MARKSTVLIGLQYGDEGKGREIDLILEKEPVGIVARFCGGANTSDTLKWEIRFQEEITTVPTLNIPGVARSFLDRVCSSFVWESKTTSRKSKRQIKNYV